jgi:hypothetical protein
VRICFFLRSGQASKQYASNSAGLETVEGFGIAKIVAKESRARYFHPVF